MKVYFSVDIETDGVVAGRNNMLSLGCAAIDMDSGNVVGAVQAQPCCVHWALLRCGHHGLVEEVAGYVHACARERCAPRGRN
jgi:hypothetical protein